MSVLGAGFFGPTEGEKKRRLQGGKAHAWKPMCGDRVVTPDELYDLFPGSGAVARAWDTWCQQLHEVSA